MEQRLRFVLAYLDGVGSMTELCRVNGISRPTGYKWIERFGIEGAEGLRDRSRAPKVSPQRTSEEMVEWILEARRRHPSWGAKKLIRWLSRRQAEQTWPARSTVAEILKRNGCVKSRRRRRSPQWFGSVRTTARQPNDLWTADFKGQFLTGDSRYCYPLTVVDSWSRYLLGCRALGSTDARATRRCFERLFRRYGLPRAIRTDNGPPFASTAVGRLSKLSVWWIRLGIRPETIEPAHPEQNGSHERMHRTLKAETTRPPAPDAAAQQRVFDRFRREFNEERPHEALGQREPTLLYRPSPRVYPSRLPEPEYPGHFERRRVSSNGRFFWRGRSLHFSKSLDGQDLGLQEVDDGVWSIHFGPVTLARLDERTRTIYAVRTS
jgi:transposase InsO family protein